MEGLILGAICLYTYSACIWVAWKELKVLQGVYTNLCCVRVNEWITGSFNVTQGLRQGCILSPTLLNDLPKHLKAAFRGIQFGDSNICCLLYTDDLVLLADSVQNVCCEELGKFPLTL